MCSKMATCASAHLAQTQAECEVSNDEANLFHPQIFGRSRRRLYSAQSNLSVDELVAKALSEYLKVPLHTLFQVSTSGALVKGIYQGAVSTGELLRHGDFGLGTFEGLDGEMVIVDGKIYQVRGDGTVQPIKEDVLIPFAAILPFTADVEFELHGPFHGRSFACCL